MEVVDRAKSLVKKYPTLLDYYEINTPIRLVHFMAQLSHESNLLPKGENLQYSRERLIEVFPAYFDEKNVEKYHHRPMATANRVYANRYSNGDEGSGDGYKYRGRGFIQLTFKANYKALSDAVGVDYVRDPDKLLNESDALIAACWFWKTKGLNELADKDNTKAITKKVNGGTNGLKDRMKWVKIYKEVFK